MMGGTIGIKSQKGNLRNIIDMTNINHIYEILMRIGVGSSCYFDVTCKISMFDSSRRKRPSNSNIMSSITEEPPSKRQNTLQYDDTENMENGTEVTPKRILVVEDNMINQKLLKKILESQGYITELADNGQEALDKVRINA